MRSYIIYFAFEDFEVNTIVTADDHMAAKSYAIEQLKNTGRFTTDELVEAMVD